MSRQAFIHIGFDKTGTSAIQKYLAENAASIRRRTGFVYPRIGRQGFEHIPIAHLAGFGFQQGLAPADPVGAQRIEDYLRREARDNLLISSEHFCYGAEQERFSRLHDLFAGYDVKIIVYVRSVPGWLRSLYGEMVKWGFRGGFADCIEANCERMDVAGFLDLWAAQFGTANLIVRLYDRDRADLIPSFLRLLGAAGAMPRAHAGVVNPSLGPLDIEILRQANLRLDHQDGRESHRLYKVYWRLKQQRPPAWPMQVAGEGGYEFIAAQRDDILRLSDAFGRRYLPCPAERAFFRERTCRDLAQPPQPAVPAADIERGCQWLIDAYRREPGTPPWLGRVRGMIGAARRSARRTFSLAQFR